MSQKIFLTYEQQLDKLKNDNGLTIANPDTMLFVLRRKSVIILLLVAINPYSKLLPVENISMMSHLKKSYIYTILMSNCALYFSNTYSI
jgi:hypothetical protein